MKRIIPYIVINIALASFAFGQSKIQKESADSSNEQEVRQAIEKYQAALLRRDIPALEQIWADDYFFVNAAGEMLSKAQRLANLNLVQPHWNRSTKRKSLRCGFIKTQRWRRAA